MTDSMTKYNHRMTAEESIGSFVTYMEGVMGKPMTDDQKEWLYNKGYEIFDTYYIDEVAQVNLATQEDKDKLLDYFSDVQQTLGKMFSHIILVEFKLYLLTQNAQ